MIHDKNKKGIWCFSFRFMALLTLLAVAGCSVEEPAMNHSEGIYNSGDGSSGSFLGTYKGKWMAGNRELGTAMLKGGTDLEISSLPIAEFLRHIVIEENVASAEASVTIDAYKLPFMQTAYSATSLYFNLSKLDYTFIYTLDGIRHEAEVVMAATGSVAVYDKQNGSFVVLLKVIGFTVDGVKTANYGKEQTLMFNSTARRSAK